MERTVNVHGKCQMDRGPSRKSGRRAESMKPKQAVKISSIITQVNTTEKPSSIEVPFLRSYKDSQKHPLLPPLIDKNKKTLVLDLDETLVHSSFQPVENANIVLPVEIQGEAFLVYTLKRPGVDQLLERLQNVYEIVIFTASLSIYANPLIDLLDFKRRAAHRLFREHCTVYSNSFVKDLSRLGRDMNNIIIVDNSPSAYALQLENAIPIDTWLDDSADNQLFQLAELLELLAQVPDVRPYIRKITAEKKINYVHATKALRAELGHSIKTPLVNSWMRISEYKASREEKRRTDSASLFYSPKYRSTKKNKSIRVQANTPTEIVANERYNIARTGAMPGFVEVKLQKGNFSRVAVFNSSQSVRGEHQQGFKFSVPSIKAQATRKTSSLRHSDVSIPEKRPLTGHPSSMQPEKMHSNIFKDVDFIVRPVIHFSNLPGKQQLISQHQPRQTPSTSFKPRIEPSIKHSKNSSSMGSFHPIIYPSQGFSGRDRIILQSPIIVNSQYSPSSHIQSRYSATPTNLQYPQSKILYSSKINIADYRSRPALSTQAFSSKSQSESPLQFSHPHFPMNIKMQKKQIFENFLYCYFNNIYYYY